MLTRLRAVRTGSDDAGFSLIEVVVGMALLTLVGTLALTFMVNTSKDVTRASTKAFDNANARAAVDKIAAELRVADTPTARAGFATGRFETFAANRVVFYANIAAGSRSAGAGRIPPTKIDIYVALDSDGEYVVKQDLYAPTVVYTNNYPSPTYNYVANYPSTPSSTQLLLKPVRSATALGFTYCTKTTDPTIACTAPKKCAASDNCTQAQLAALGSDISAVTVSVSPVKRKGVRSQTLQTTIAITGEVT